MLYEVITCFISTRLGNDLEYLSVLFGFLGLLFWMFFANSPIGKIGIIKHTIREFVIMMNDFKDSSNKIIIENIKF